MSVLIDKLIAILISLSFLSFLSLLKGGGIILGILVLSIFGLFINQSKNKALEKWEKFLLISYISYFTLALFNNYIFDGAISNIDTASRFLLVIPIFFYLRKSNVPYKSLEYGLILASGIFGINSIFPIFFDF